MSDFGEYPQLPEDVQPVFKDLCQDLVSLHDKWRLYLDLFSNGHTVDLLDDVARASFQMVEESLRSDVTMSISRLSDERKSSAGGENLSIQALVDELPSIPDLKALWEDFHDKCKPLRRYRNKRIGHNDFDTALRPHDNPLPDIGRVQVDEILKAASKLMKHVLTHFGGGELGFERTCIGGGEDLIHWLKMAWECEQVKQRRLSGGMA